jgi:4-hydroxybenzoate polyprenyltransferase
LASVSPLRASVRADEWWDYKLVPVLAAFYATALTLRVPVSSLWSSAVILLLALVPGAAYVSVINDVTDREEDAAAGKTNRAAGRSRGATAALIVAPIAAGLAFTFWWRRDPLLLGAYLAAWLAFSLYSLPPFRLKTRGIFGVLCDASGAHLFPTLVAVVLAFRGAAQSVRPLWLASVGVWAFAYGLRGILWHQLTDRDNDRGAAVRTFAERHAPQVSIRIGTFVAFPLELAALAAMLWQLRDAWPVALLAAYALLAWLRVYRWRMTAVIVKPKPQFLIVLAEYYDAFLPVAILIASSLRHPLDVVVLIVHVALFHRRLGQTKRDVAQLWRERHWPRR